MLEIRLERRERIDSSALKGWQRFLLFIKLQRYVLPLWDKLLLRLLCTQASAMLVLMPPVLLGELVDKVFPAGDLPGLFRIFALSISAMLISQVLLFIGGIPNSQNVGGLVPESILGNYMIARITLRLRMQFYAHLQRLSVHFYRGRPIGDHMFRSTADVDEASLLASESIPLIVSTLQRIIMTSYLLVSLGGALFGYLIAYLGIFFVLKQIIITTFRRRDRDFRTAFAGLESVTREMLASGKLLSGYSRLRLAERWYGSFVTRMLGSQFRRELFMYFDLHITNNAFNIALPLFSLFIGFTVLEGNRTLGEYLTASGLFFLLITPFQELISLYHLVRQRLVPVERLVETLSVHPDVADPPHAVAPAQLKGEIRFENVSFNYPGCPPVLQDVNIAIRPGEKIALVGPIGAGKSTLTSLLLRFYDPCAGRILIDGLDLRAYSQSALRTRMAIVMQQVNTFTESIRANILYGHPLASEEEMLHAAELSGVHEFTAPLREGYNTVLREGGSLSGGQKQRICIARALVRHPFILILDEATSALDPVTENQVLARIDHEFAGVTRIIIAHNLLSAKNADRIFVLDAGRIVESGTHAELMRPGTAYAAHWSQPTVCNGSHQSIPI